MHLSVKIMLGSFLINIRILIFYLYENQLLILIISLTESYCLVELLNGIILNLN